MQIHFRKKPVEIEAVTVAYVLLLAGDHWSELPPWIEQAHAGGVLAFHKDAISIVTLEGVMKADADDWIIRSVKGELYPCKPEIFQATYEAVF